MIPEEVPSTSAQASDAPPHPRRRKRTDDGKAFGCAVHTPVANRPRLWMISSAALAIILVSYLRSVGPLTSQDTLMKAHGRAKTVTLRTAYSGRHQYVFACVALIPATHAFLSLDYAHSHQCLPIRTETHFG